MFVAASDIERARHWHRGLPGLAPGGEIQFGHLHVLPMAEGSGLVLDSKGSSGPHDGMPAFHFDTSMCMRLANRLLLPAPPGYGR